MSHFESETRLRFLNQAGRLLAGKSPVVAANLNSEGTKLTLNSQQQLSSSRRTSVCTGCGTGLAPGETSVVTIESGKRKKREAGGRETDSRPSRPKATAWAEKTLIIHCLICESQSRQPLHKEPKAKPIHSTPNPGISDLSTSNPKTSAIQSPILVPGAPASQKATSRVRTKRRKASSLQALLSKHKDQLANQDTSTIGLNLSDFMKES